MRLESLNPRLLVATGFLAGLVFQLLLGTSYVGAAVDPVAQSTGVPVAFVNLDDGDRGDRFLARLEAADTPVAWVPTADRQTAVEGVERKTFVGAIVVPVNFTEALSSFGTAEPRAAVVETLLGPGNTRTGSLVAQEVMAQAFDRLRREVRDHALDAATADADGAAFPVGGGGVVTVDQARWLAEPVKTSQTTVNPIPPASATGLAPVYLAMAAWVGGYFGAVALEKYRPQHGLSARRRVLLAAPASLFQAVLAVACLAWFAGLHVPDPFTLVLVLAVATWMAYAVVGFLVDVMGLSGVVPAFAVLALGLPASGGVYPVEMLPPFFQALHPVSPFTWMVEALRTHFYTPLAGDLGGMVTRLAVTAVAFSGASVAWAWARDRARTGRGAES